MLFTKSTDNSTLGSVTDSGWTIVRAAGSAGAPAMSWSGDVGTGSYHLSSGNEEWLFL